jgi:hypothetical protein
MAAVRAVAAIVGLLLVGSAALSVLGTVVVPRRVRSRLARAVGISVDRVFHAVADTFDTYERRDRFLAGQAPVQLIAQLAVWLAVFELGFAFLLWPFLPSAGLGGALQEIGSSLFTLGYVVPQRAWAAAIDDLAALAGLGTLALQIGYLPTLYAAFNRRETLVTMLDSRAGVPSWGPELLARTHYGLGTGTSAVEQLPELFEAWESWSADVAESHTTYLPLIRFRSPHALSSWVTAQLAVLDAAAMYLALIPDAPGAISARLCLRGGFTCLRSIARAIGQVELADDPDPNDGISLSYDEFVDAVERLRRVDFPLARPTEDAWLDFVGWRINYEAAAQHIAWLVDAPPALWSGPRRHRTAPMPPLRPLTLRAGKPPLPPPV